MEVLDALQYVCNAAVCSIYRPGIFPASVTTTSPSANNPRRLTWRKGLRPADFRSAFETPCGISNQCGIKLRFQAFTTASARLSQISPLWMVNVALIFGLTTGVRLCSQGHLSRVARKLKRLSHKLRKLYLHGRLSCTPRS